MRLLHAARNAPDSLCWAFSACTCYDGSTARTAVLATNRRAFMVLMVPRNNPSLPKSKHGRACRREALPPSPYDGYVSWAVERFQMHLKGTFVFFFFFCFFCLFLCFFC